MQVVRHRCACGVALQAWLGAAVAPCPGEPTHGPSVDPLRACPRCGGLFVAGHCPLAASCDEPVVPAELVCTTPSRPPETDPVLERALRRRAWRDHDAVHFQSHATGLLVLAILASLYLFVGATLWKLGSLPLALSEFFFAGLLGVAVVALARCEVRHRRAVARRRGLPLAPPRAEPPYRGAVALADHRGNLERLLELLDLSDPVERVEAAEIHRHLARFDECLALLAALSPSPWVAAVRRRALRRDRFPGAV